MAPRPGGVCASQGPPQFLRWPPQRQQYRLVSPDSPDGLGPRRRLPSLPGTICLEGLGVDEPGVFCGGPLRGAYPSGLFPPNSQIRSAQLKTKIRWAPAAWSIDIYTVGACVAKITRGYAGDIRPGMRYKSGVAVPENR